MATLVGDCGGSYLVYGRGVDNRVGGAGFKDASTTSLPTLPLGMGIDNPRSRKGGGGIKCDGGFKVRNGIS